MDVKVCIVWFCSGKEDLSAQFVWSLKYIWRYKGTGNRDGEEHLDYLIFIIFCCIANYPKFSSFGQKIIATSQFL